MTSAEQRAAIGPMKHTGNSANIAFYREKRDASDYVWCEVMRSQPYTKGQGFDDSAIPTFYVRVYRTDTSNKVADFTYTPKSKPPAGPLSAVTLTRLVRETLA